MMDKTHQATQELIIEAIKSRADARGPRVAVLLELPEWPPRMDRSALSNPQSRWSPSGPLSCQVKRVSNYA